MLDPETLGAGDAHASIDAAGIAWRLGATLFFVLLNGFFVAAEFALVKVREPRMAKLAREGNKTAPRVQHILGHLDQYLSACQLGITLASLILGALGEPAVSVILIALAEAMGITVADNASWLPIVSIGLAFAVITTLHMTVGEQAPKMWALRKPESTALKVSSTLRAFNFVFKPFIIAINWISNWILRLFGLPADLGHGDSHSAEEIRSILSLSVHAGDISEHEFQLTENVFRMIELEVRHIIVPRVEVDFLTQERSNEENLERIRTSGHSRFALCRQGLDSIVGIVHAKDVLDSLLQGETPVLSDLAREPLFVPDTMSISNFLQEVQINRQHCAVVLDEHGTAIGLAFREDALEEIVGPLGDEFDDASNEFRPLADGSYELSGRLSVPEVLDRLDFELDEEEEEEEDTIGGHITARLGRLPKTGDTVRVGPYRATVLDASKRRVQLVKLTLVEKNASEEQAAEAEESEADSI
ncbi:Hemolysin C [Planctomycetes bacterium Poly30]|uniref:Hemolysin C n=1 Tax=Saltatorellus ferox TaxID=2528018 RepID=A0A518F0U3_9BACT|nr:Hemolysin C [Planctomycetes bacterium Poly30]